jgi:cytochrome c553
MLLLAGSLLAVALAAPPPPLAAQMHERYALLTRIRDEVVQGRLDGARSAARSLAELAPPEGLPVAWAPFVAVIDAEAGKVAAAPDLLTAAMATPRIAVACAGCHGATSGGPGLDRAGDIPPQVWEPDTNMQLHAWGVDWMWLGLLANDDAAWTRGAGELAKQPLPLRFETATPEGGRTQLEQGVYVLAGRALAVDEPAERAELLGTMFATCTQCHLQRPPKR